MNRWRVFPCLVFVVVFAAQVVGQPVSSLRDRRMKLGELFLFGMVVLEPGGGTVIFPDNRPPARPGNHEVMVPTDSIVETQTGETATLRLGCGSRILIGPLSRVRIRRFAFDLDRGECLIRHVGSRFPLKVAGEIPLLITKDSLAELARGETGLRVRVQVGTVRTARGAEFQAGKTVRVEGTTVISDPTAIPLKNWIGGSTESFPPLPELFDPVQDPEGFQVSPPDTASETAPPGPPGRGSLYETLEKHLIDPDESLPRNN